MKTPTAKKTQEKGRLRSKPGRRGDEPKKPSRRPIQKTGRFAGHPYQLTQAEYAGRYDKSLPTIKRWWRDGKPLDDPDEMGEYLSPRGRKSAGEPDDKFESPSFVPPTDSAGADGSEIPIQLDETFFEGVGALAAIERLNKAERERAAAYYDAIRHNRPAQILANRFREWTGIIEALRKMAKDEPGIRKSNDLTIDVAEMDAAVGVIYAAFRNASRNLPSRAAAKLLAVRTREEIVEILEAEIEILLRTLTEITLDEAARADGCPPGISAPMGAGEEKPVKLPKKKRRPRK